MTKPHPKSDVAVAGTEGNAAGGGDASVRQCAVTRERLGKEALVRFVLSPGGVVTPDVAEKLPGRGVWIKADRLVLAEGVKKNAFARAFKTAVQVPDGLGAVTGKLITSRMDRLYWDLNPAATHLAYVLDTVKYRRSTLVYYDIQAQTSRRLLGYTRAGYVNGTLTIEGPEDQKVLYGNRMALGDETLVIAGIKSGHQEGLWMVSLPRATAVWHEAPFAAPGVSGDHVYYRSQKPAVWLNPDGTAGAVFEQKAGLSNPASVPFWAGAGSAYMADQDHTSIVEL